MKTHNPNNEWIKRSYFDYLKEASGHSEAPIDVMVKALNRFEVHTRFRESLGADSQLLSNLALTGSSPMSVQAKGQPAAIVPATTQTPRAVIPTEIKNERTVSMKGPKDRI